MRSRHAGVLKTTRRTIIFPQKIGTNYAMVGHCANALHAGGCLAIFRRRSILTTAFAWIGHTHGLNITDAGVEHPAI